MPVFPIPAAFGTETDFQVKYPENVLREEFTNESYERLGGFEKVVRVKLEAAYLKHLTYIGAKERYGDPISDDIVARLEFELDTIKRMGYPGYFLITQDFINKAREMGVIVGPGRGSAAGSAVAYCTGITNIDPIKYNLLFERFLNPDRISLPDVDIDFDDDGRQLVLDYVTEKYGADRVAHICTFEQWQQKWPFAM
jgi:DNA polymerase III subunit alpha